MRHSCAAPIGGGKVYITGGQEPDYSEAFAQSFVFDPATQEFSPLPSLPVALYGHASVLLANGTLLVFGGIAQVPGGGATLQPLDFAYALDTTAGGDWQKVAIGGASPGGRHGMSASLNTDGTIFIFGGLDNETGPLNEGWLLDPAAMQWSQTFLGTGRSGKLG